MTRLLPTTPRAYPARALPTRNATRPTHTEVRVTAKVIPTPQASPSPFRARRCVRSGHGHKRPPPTTRAAVLLPARRATTSELSRVVSRPRTATVGEPRPLRRRQTTATLAELIPLIGERKPQTMEQGLTESVLRAGRPTTLRLASPATRDGRTAAKLRQRAGPAHPVAQPLSVPTARALQRLRWVHGAPTPTRPLLPVPAAPITATGATRQRPSTRPTKERRPKLQLRSRVQRTAKTVSSSGLPGRAQRTLAAG